MSKIIVKDLAGPASSSNKIYIASGSQLDIAGSPDGASAINLAVDAGDITTGTLGSGLTYPGKLEELKDLPGTGGVVPTARVWNELSADDTAAATVSTSAPYSWDRKLNNEEDPYGIISLSSNVVTVTYAGKYLITFNQGNYFRSQYCTTQLIKGSTVIAQAPIGYNSTDDKSAGNFEGYWIGDLSASDTLKIRTRSTDSSAYWWRPAAMDPVVFGQMIIRLIG
tara:strand:+ start:84 stop:755 length:672 start_codon:yes stop_codon:yes gene_type:complete